MDALRLSKKCWPRWIERPEPHPDYMGRFSRAGFEIEVTSTSKFDISEGRTARAVAGSRGLVSESVIMDVWRILGRVNTSRLAIHAGEELRTFQSCYEAWRRRSRNFGLTRSRYWT
jgi:hypothetical protein